jgi:4-amino-4-deoxy-L-arabinose transferase-like glycosyltransferase
MNAAAPGPTLACSTLLAALLSVLLWQSGALQSDLGADPDEPAHAVTALMVRDALVEGTGGSPMVFARAYYDHFPKVALGHYPPGYYLTSGLALLPFADPDVLLVLQVLFLTGIAAGVVRLVATHFGGGLAWAAALLVITLPPQLKLSVLVMADLQLALLCLGAAMLWLRFLQSGLARHSLAFGLLASAAILTKGSGLMLAALPPLTVLFTRRWSLLKEPAWWLAALPGALLAAPWMLYSAGITGEGMVAQSVPEFFQRAAVEYARLLAHVLGWPLLAVAAWALLRLTLSGCRAGRLGDFESVLLAWLIGGVAVMLLVPAGVSSRYLVPLLVPLALLAVHSLGRLPAPAIVTGSLPWVLLAVTLLQVGGRPHKTVSGYGAAAARALAESAGDTPSRWLVASDARGEGAVIAAAAFALDGPARVGGRLQVLRASKELGSSDWLGRGYRPTFTEVAALRAHLEERGIDWILIDDSPPPARRQAHQALLSEALVAPNSGWRLVEEETIIRPDLGESGRLRLFRREAAKP